MGVFSDFELKQLGFKFKGASEYKTATCIGAYEEELEAKTVTKSCRGVVVKRITKGTGNGTLKITAHMPWEIYTDAYGMNLDTLIEGVKAYGRNSIHENFCMVADVEDEDGNEKLKAYPNCVVSTGVTRKIENGAEEVAEVELEVACMPDEYGNGMYEAIVDDLTDENVKTTWLTNFTPALVQKA